MAAQRIVGLRFKLGLYVIGFGGLLLFLSGYFALEHESDVARREAEARGIALLRALAVPCGLALATNQESLLDSYVAQFADKEKSLDLLFLTVLDYSGKVIAHTNSREYGKLYDDAFTLRAREASDAVAATTADSRSLMVAVPIVSGLRWGTLEASFSLVGTERASSRARVRLLWTGLLSLLGSATLAYTLISRLVVRPVMSMNDMVRRFGEGQLQARVSLTAQDELGELATGLDAMGQRIQDYTVQLEHLVDERTRALSDANDRLIEANQRLEQLARTDALTGLFNRRYVLEQLTIEIKRGTRTDHPFTLVMVDVDHFKHYNDNHGHSAGDEVLQRLSQLMSQNLRSTDVVARYGGEEFMILLLDTGPDEGLATARKLQQIVAGADFPRGEQQPGGRLTVSIGVAFFPRDASEARALIDQADDALYRSKELGRNRVTAWRAA